MTIKAIETRYAGCRFRSRLEARWAVFFDTLGVEWEHEPEGFETSAGRYLPDFRLPSLGENTWFEVKGPSTSDADKRRMEAFAAEALAKLFIAEGSLPDPRLLDDHGHPYRDGAFDITYVEGSEYEGDEGTPGLDPSDPFYQEACPAGVHLGGDVHYAWCACPWCGKPGLQFDARSARICGYKAHHPDEESALAALKGRSGCWRADDKCYTGDDPKIVRAYVAARSARFEHGEKG